MTAELSERRCAFDGCDAPIPAGPSGRVSPARLYCSQQHMRLASRLVSAGRDAQLRLAQFTPAPRVSSSWDEERDGPLPVSPGDPRPWWERRVCWLARCGRQGEAAGMLRLVATQGDYPSPSGRTVAELDQVGMTLHLDPSAWAEAAGPGQGWALLDGTAWSFEAQRAWWARTFGRDEGEYPPRPKPG